MERRRLEDPRELRALAHPVRVAIMENLGYRGPLTATQLADLVDESPSNCSWHLRKLADAGLIEPDPDGARGRQRPWRTTFLAYEIADSRPAQDLEELVVHRQTDRFLQAVREDHDTPWTMSPVWATPEEFAEIRRHLQAFSDAVHALWERVPDPSARPEGARLYETMAWIVPFEDD